MQFEGCKTDYSLAAQRQENWRGIFAYARLSYCILILKSPVLDARWTLHFQLDRNFFSRPIGAYLTITLALTFCVAPPLSVSVIGIV